MWYNNMHEYIRTNHAYTGRRIGCQLLGERDRTFGRLAKKALLNGEFSESEIFCNIGIASAFLLRFNMNL